MKLGFQTTAKVLVGSGRKPRTETVNVRVEVEVSVTKKEGPK